MTEDNPNVFLGINEENRVVVACDCGYKTITYTLEDIEYFKEVGYPECCYCGRILFFIKQYKEL